MLPYLDVPLQHGSEAVLARMKRPHNVEKVTAMVRGLRQALPDIVLRTSFIAGFPGETEAEFEELLAFAREIEFDHAGCFTYSRQQWTGAFDMEGQVLGRGEGRAAETGSCGSSRRLPRAGRGDSPGGRWICWWRARARMRTATRWSPGRTYREAPEVDGLVIAAGSAAPGERVRVRIDESGDYDLFGTVLKPRRAATGRQR